MPRKILKINYDEELNFNLLGIVSGLKDYRLVFEINKTIYIDLQRTPDHVLLVGKNNSQLRYVRFQYYDDVGLTYTLIGNKNQSQLLLPELSMIDYLLLIEPSDNEICKQTLAAIKNINHLQAVFTFNVMELKSRHNLIGETIL
jgi:hypothetical protein